MSIFESYTGPAGPTTDQAEQNTLHLASILEEKEIPFQKNTEYMFMLCGVESLNLELRNEGKTIFVGYDRWGFVVDGDGGDCAPDQWGIDDTIEFIQDFMKSFTY